MMMSKGLYLELISLPRINHSGHVTHPSIAYQSGIPMLSVRNIVINATHTHNVTRDAWEERDNKLVGQFKININMTIKMRIFE